MNPFVQIQGVSKSFPTKKGSYTAVQNLNLSVSQGEFVAFIGHSGCGKSTLLNMIAGLYEPTQGKVWVDGREIKGPGSDRAMVFQNYALLPWLSVAENVFQAVDSVYEKNLTTHEKRELSDKFIQMVGLGQHHDKLPGQLSGGMKQRTAIARAFATKPEVLLLDEPFGALDALTKSALHDELLEIWNDSAQNGPKQTIFMVTHDIDEAIYLCDRIVVFTNGPAATIDEVIEVPIPRPRDKRLISTVSAYSEIRSRLIDLLSIGKLEPKKASSRDARTVRVGFMPLTDCAALVMAKELELDHKYGFKLELVKDSSWTGLRDKLLTGELNAAHCLWSLPFSVAAGVSESESAVLPIAMSLAANGQAITLSLDKFPIPSGDLRALKRAFELQRQIKGEPLVFAVTLEGSTHDLWLRTTLDAAEISRDDYRLVIIAPPQMVINLSLGNIDGFSAGEPWNALAANRGIGWTFLTSQDIQADYPEKCLAVNADFATQNRSQLKNLMLALLEASLWLDNAKNLDRAAQKLAKPEYVGVTYEVIKDRLRGHYDMGGEAGIREYETKLAFSDGGRLNAPHLAYGSWFLNQFAALGLEIRGEINADELSQSLILSELYREVVEEMTGAGFKISLPDEAEITPLQLAVSV